MRMRLKGTPRVVTFFSSMHARVMAACFLSALIASIVATLSTYTASVSVIQRNAREQATAMIVSAHQQLDDHAYGAENLAMSLSIDKETSERF